MTHQNLTLDQVRALCALHQSGTFESAGKLLGKAHTGVLYALKQMETALGCRILERRSYRTRFTARGKELLAYAERILEAERELLVAARREGAEWEAKLTIVYDGVISSDLLMEAISAVKKDGSKTKISAVVSHLSRVEKEFDQEDADLMISVLPPERLRIEHRKLASVPMKLVASSEHSLIRKSPRKRAWTLSELESETLITLAGSDARLGLPSTSLDRLSRFQVGDFSAKKTAILRNLGYGWLPVDRIQRELKSGRLKPIPAPFRNHHVLHPTLSWRRSDALGSTAQALIRRITEIFDESNA